MHELVIIKTAKLIWKCKKFQKSSRQSRPPDDFLPFLIIDWIINSKNKETFQ